MLLNTGLSLDTKVSTHKLNLAERIEKIGMIG